MNVNLRKRTERGPFFTTPACAALGFFQFRVFRGFPVSKRLDYVIHYCLHLRDKVYPICNFQGFGSRSHKPSGQMKQPCDNGATANQGTELAWASLRMDKEVFTSHPRSGLTRFPGYMRLLWDRNT